MSHVWLDAKYVSQLSFRLRNFKKKGQNTWNFSCPVCGDSHNNKSKARGYVYSKKGKLMYHCHNCNVTMSIPRFIKYLDQVMYDEYIKEKLMVEGGMVKKPETPLEELVKKMSPPKFVKDTPLQSLKKVSQLKPESVVKQYITKRMIPAKYHHKLFLCKEFKAWVNTLQPGKFESDGEGNLHDEPRLIIPFIDQEGNLFGFQGRSFRKNTPLRYITIMLNEEMPKIFGLDTLDPLNPNKYIVEGPIDSMFIPNCLAACGGDITTDLPEVANPKEFVCVYDNEPRNVHTVKKMEKAIDKGYKVCIWPSTVKEKDVNDMVMAGLTPQQVVDIIRESSYSGLEAKLMLQQWKKV